MSRLQDLLNEMTDPELANFFYYRYDEFIPASKEKIRNELEKRGIKTESIDWIISASGKQMQQTGNANHCPRCYSDKFYTSSETETMNFSYVSIDYKMDYKTCMVCLYSEEKEIQQNKLPVWNAFGFIRFLINRKK